MTKTNQLERGRDRLELTDILKVLKTSVEYVLIEYINDGISINNIDIHRPISPANRALAWMYE